LNNFENLFTQKRGEELRKGETSFMIPKLQFILGRPENVGLFAGAVLCLHPNSVSVAARSALAIFLVVYEEVEFPHLPHQ
jgi:hypothetical protein